jgi:hypothetical protein
LNIFLLRIAGSSTTTTVRDSKAGQILNEESLQQGIDWKVNLGVVVLGMVLLISLAAVLAEERTRELLMQ